MRYDVAIVDQDPTGTELAEHLNNMASKGWTLDKLIALPKPGGRRSASGHGQRGQARQAAVQPDH